MIRNLLESGRPVCIAAGAVHVEPKPLALLPGSFNPLHRGHVELAAAAAARLGVPVHFELSITNADKPELPFDEVERRLAQFISVGPILLTRAATFEQKAALFPGAVFVLGYDTAVRVVDPRYYGGEEARDAALQRLLDTGCRLVVGGRLDERGAFRVWERSAVAEVFAALFVPLMEADFRVDLSSRVLRAERK
jgi:hypothetical protein